MHRHALASLASLLLVAACGAAQKPVSIAGVAPPDARARVSTALTTEGQIPDPKTSTDTMVATEWRDTGFKWGFVDNQQATLVRRYVVSIGPNETIVRLDAKRCAIGAFEMKGTNVDGRCAQVDEIPDVMQTELDRVGAKVTSALK